MFFVQNRARILFGHFLAEPFATWIANQTLLVWQPLMLSEFNLRGKDTCILPDYAWYIQMILPNTRSTDSAQQHFGFTLCLSLHSHILMQNCCTECACGGGGVGGRWEEKISITLNDDEIASVPKVHGLLFLRGWGAFYAQVNIQSIVNTIQYTHTLTQTDT